MTYKDVLTNQCTTYAKRYPKAVFIGYNTLFGSRMYGTLNGVPRKQCIEAPVAENLMVGLAMGMSLEGYRPVVCFERHDFMLLAMDALINHMDKMPWLSEGQYKYPILIRAIVGGSTPLNPGPQHTQNYSTPLIHMLKHTPIHNALSIDRIRGAWNEVGKSDSGAVILIEHKNWYDKPVAGETIKIKLTHRHKRAIL